MNDEQRAAEHLSAFVDACQGGEQPALDSAEKTFAAELHDLARQIEPDAAFLIVLDQRFGAPPVTIPLNSRHAHKMEEISMLTLNQTAHPKPVRALSRLPLTLAAALVVVIMSCVILFARGTGGVSPLPAALQATPELSLPLPVGGYVSDFSEETLNQMHEAGMTWVAASVIYTAPFETVLDTAQSLITIAHSNDFKILLQVIGTPSDMISDRENYAANFATVVGKIAALNPDAIEVWSEPNLDRYWLTGEVSSYDYVQLLRQAYTAIKARNPKVMVISAAPAPTGAQEIFPEQIVNDDVYYANMAAAGLEDTADCIGMHYVEGAVPPDQTSGDPRDNYPTRYLTTMLERAYAHLRVTGLPLCITQMGYASGEEFGASVPSYFGWSQQTTVDQQAAWTAQAMEIIANQPDTPVALVIIYRVNSHNLAFDEASAITSSLFALIRSDGSCPTCDALAVLRR